MSGGKRLVQYVVVRKDLCEPPLSWPVGAVIAQACHATSAVLHLFHQDPDTQAYLQDTDNMHKIVLGVGDEAGLREVGKKLEEAGVLHKLWVERPEEVPTALVTKPYPREAVQRHFKGIKLF